MSEASVTSAVLADWSVWLPDHVDCYQSSDRLPLHEFVGSVEKAAETAGQPGLGWLVGKHGNYLSRGRLGYAVTGAGTLGDGLSLLCRFYPLIQDASKVKLERSGDRVSLSYRILDPGIWPREQDALYTLGIFSTLLQAAAPDIWQHVQIRLEAQKSSGNSDLVRLLHAPVRFGAQANEITFPARYLNARFDVPNALIFDEIRLLGRSLSDRNRTLSVTDRARYVILSALSEGSVCQDTVAGQLGLSPRTLRRKLSVERTSYQKLLDECRMEVAAHELTVEKNVSFSQMALRLGYSEHSTFTRAFYRWAGMTPKRFRGIASRNQVAWGH